MKCSKKTKNPLFRGGGEKRTFKKWLGLVLGGIMRLGRPKFMPYNQRKIDNQIEALNVSTMKLGQRWERIPAEYALTKVKIKDTGEAIFSPSSGIPLLVFMNTETFELRIFPAKFFEEE